IRIGNCPSFRIRNWMGCHPSCDRKPKFVEEAISTYGFVGFAASIRSRHCQTKAMKPGTATSTGQPNDHTTDQSIDARNSPMLREWHGAASGVHSSQENA